MRKPVLLALILALSATGLPAEDRTETIADSKGYKELVYRGEALAEERSYDAKGAILEERAFDAEALPLETRSYIREGGRIARVEARDASGVPSGSMDYRYDRYGRLLGIASEGSLGVGSAGMIASAALPQGTWVAHPGEAEGSAGGGTTAVLGYDEAGRATIIQSMRDGAAVSIEKRSYREGGLLASVRTEDKLSGFSSELVYDEKGRKWKRTDTPAKGLVVKVEYRYDESDRLSQELTVRAGHRSIKTMTYAEDGSLAREQTSRDGELLLAVSYIEGGREEELYEDGVVFVKATYLGGRKVKDEFYADGTPVRTRDY